MPKRTYAELENFDTHEPQDVENEVEIVNEILEEATQPQQENSDDFRLKQILIKTNLDFPRNFENIRRHPKFSTVIELADILTRHALLDNRNFFNCLNKSRFYKNSYTSILDGILCLEENNLLNQNHLDVMFSCGDPQAFAQAVANLNNKGIATQANIECLPKSAAPLHLSRIFCYLFETKILNKKNIEIASSLTNWELAYLDDVLSILHNKSLLNQAHYRTISKLKRIDNLKTIVEALLATNLLNQKNFSAVVKLHSKYVNGIVALQTQNNLTQEHLDILFHQINPEAFAHVLNNLKSLNLFHPDNLRLLEKSNIEKLSRGLPKLKEFNLLNQVNFARVCEDKEPDIMCAHIIADYFLDMVNINTPDNHKLIDRLKDPLNVVIGGLSTLHQCNLLNQAHLLTLLNHKHPLELINFLSIFHNHSPLNKENYDRITQEEDIHKISQGAIILKNVLTQTHLNILLEHPSPLEYAKAVIILKDQNLLNDLNHSLLLKSALPKMIANDLASLANHPQLTAFYQSKVLGIKKPLHFADALLFLHAEDLSTHENQERIATHPNPADLADALSYLKKHQLESPEIIEIICKNKSPRIFAHALHVLILARLDNAANRKTLSKKTGVIEQLSRLFVNFNHANILNQNTFDLLIDFSKNQNKTTLENLVCVVRMLNQSNILTERNFLDLISPRYQILLNRDIVTVLWERLPPHLLTQENFQRFLNGTERENPIQFFFELLNRLTNLVPQNNPSINHNQSIHNSSIHRSASKSAINLINRYGAEINIYTIFQKIDLFIDGLNEESIKNLSAKRCLMRIVNSQHYFKDPHSNVSLEMLLALAFVAIHDDEMRIGTLEDGLGLFVEALYEIQRGYNINEQGIDNNEEDRPICYSGSFNKIIEKLNGIHPDVELIYISHSGAMKKFPIIANKFALEYLNHLLNENSHHLKNVLEQLKTEECLEPIWGEIKDQVKQELWEEFHEAYDDKEDNKTFKSIVENGSFLSVPDLSAFEKSLDLEKSLPKLSNHSLWSGYQGQSCSSSSAQPNHLR